MGEHDQRDGVRTRADRDLTALAAGNVELVVSGDRSDMVALRNVEAIPILSARDDRNRYQTQGRR